MMVGHCWCVFRHNRQSSPFSVGCNKHSHDYIFSLWDVQTQPPRNKSITPNPPQKSDAPDIYVRRCGIETSAKLPTISTWFISALCFFFLFFLVRSQPIFFPFPTPLRFVTALSKQEVAFSKNILTKYKYLRISGTHLLSLTRVLSDIR